MWSPLLTRSRLTLISGARRDLRDFHQELAHHAAHNHAGCVLWCDGDHGCNPYDFGELNLERGRIAEEGAQRVLVKRCMTPFQWDTVLTQHLDQKLLDTEASLVLVAPYDRLFSTDELQDWEQEDYVQSSLQHLQDLAQEHEAPIVISVDMNRWLRTHPLLAQATQEAVQARWSIDRPDGRWRAHNPDSGQVIDPWLRRQVTLWDFMEKTTLQTVPLVVSSHSSQVT